jgi:iron complex outermembrane receptor protein
LRFNIDAFHTQVRDFQANVVDNAAVIALRSYLANIQKVTVDGVEFDASARLATHLTLRASGAYANGRYADYANGSCPIELTGASTGKCDLSGKGLPGLPRWSGSLGAQYSHALAGGELLVNADAFGKTRIYGDATDSVYTEIGGYVLLNGSLGYRSRKGWEVAAFARNALGKNYLQNVTVQAGNSGLILGTPAEPRLIGITFRASQF